jgi:hypothetical protein
VFSLSYRTRINNVQIFGNNEYYSEWIEFIKSQSIAVGEDGDYDGEIVDVMNALKVIENIVLRIEKEHREDGISPYDTHRIVSQDGLSYTSLFDFSYVYDKILQEDIDKTSRSLTDQLLEIQKNSYMFMPLAFLSACGDCIKKNYSSITDGRLYNYSLVDGKKIHVHAG